MVHCPKRATQCSELYRTAYELAKKRPCMSAMNWCICNGAEGMPTTTALRLEKGLMHGLPEPSR